MLDAPACAVELLHAYSLIHDDLPAMDDDDLRRGKPSCHKAYDEATAILAGDALQSLAFRVISAPSQRGTPAKQRIELIHCFADASGSMGMCGGQALDLEAEDATLTLKDLEAVHLKKTGALIRASVQMGALSAPDVDEELVDNLDRYARSVGLAFQIRDDILDIEGDTQTLGKPQGSDVAQHKSTYPALLGLQESKDLADELNRTAQASIRALGDEANPLRWLADFAVSRSV
jgi:farnesyl diphosphate synthase